MPPPCNPCPRLFHPNPTNPTIPSKNKEHPYWYCLLWTSSLTLPPSSLICWQNYNPNIHIKCFRCFRCFRCFKWFATTRKPNRSERLKQRGSCPKLTAQKIKVTLNTLIFGVTFIRSIPECLTADGLCWFLLKKLVCLKPYILICWFDFNWHQKFNGSSKFNIF